MIFIDYFLFIFEISLLSLTNNERFINVERFLLFKMDKFEKLMRELDLGPSIQPTQMNWSSIGEAASTLWSEASHQLRSEAQERRRADEARGKYMNQPDQAYGVSDASIFKRYESLVQKHMVDSRRPKKRDVDSSSREIIWNTPKDKNLY
jgi:hypothetical protein